MVTALTYSPVPFSAIWDVTETAVETSLRMADPELVTESTKILSIINCARKLRMYVLVGLLMMNIII